MRYSVHFLGLALAFSLPCIAFAQNSPPVRDAQGIQVLTAALTAAGGLQAIDGIQDFTETGTISFNDANGPLEGTATIYGKGLYEFRVDSALSSGQQSFIVNQNGGEIIDVNGNATPVSALNLMTAGSLSVPAVRAADAINDTTVGVSYMGQVTWNGAPALQVHITPQEDPNLTSLPGLSTLGSFDLYIDPTSYQILGLAESVWPSTSFLQPIPHAMQFCGYTAFDGIVVPTTFSETVNGHQTWTVTVSQVQFNTGLQDSLFTF